MSKIKEFLTCEMCSDQWSRTRSRGRKPRFCPECIKENVVAFEEVVTMPKEDAKKTRTATKWECPSCGENITVFVNLQYPPICRNPAKHSTKAVEMKQTVLTRQKEAVA